MGKIKVFLGHELSSGVHSGEIGKGILPKLGELLVFFMKHYELKVEFLTEAVFTIETTAESSESVKAHIEAELNRIGLESKIRVE